MKKIIKFEKFIRESYEPKLLKSHSKEDLIESLVDMQTVYSKEDLEGMNIDQLDNLYNEVINAKSEEVGDQENLNQLEYESKRWIQDAIKRPGSLRRRLKKKEGEKITYKEIDSELQALRGKDKSEKLSKRDRRKQRQLVLAKTLKGL